MGSGNPVTHPAGLCLDGFGGVLCGLQGFRQPLVRVPDFFLSRSIAQARQPDIPPCIPRPRQLAWAQLLRRVLDIDALSCPRCSTIMVVLAFLTDPAVIIRILTHLGLPSDILSIRSGYPDAQTGNCLLQKLLDFPLLTPCTTSSILSPMEKTAMKVPTRKIRGPA